MSDDNNKQDGKLDRRSLLIGAAAGVAGTAAVAVGAAELQKLQRTIATPKALPDGAKPQVELSFADSHPAYTRDIKAPPGAPNIITIILDDVGFSDLGCYGSEIPTPNFDALAAGGLRYTNFRTTAMCSPTRASLLCGRNRTRVGVDACRRDSFGSGYAVSRSIEAGSPGKNGHLASPFTMQQPMSRSWIQNRTIHQGRGSRQNVALGSCSPTARAPPQHLRDRDQWHYLEAHQRVTLAVAVKDGWSSMEPKSMHRRPKWGWVLDLTAAVPEPRR